MKKLTVINSGTSDRTLAGPITTSAGFTATNFGVSALTPNASGTFDLVD